MWENFELKKELIEIIKNVGSSNKQIPVKQKESVETYSEKPHISNFEKVY